MGTLHSLEDPSIDEFMTDYAVPRERLAAGRSLRK